MSLAVNQETCIGCGTCVSICSASFKMNDLGKSEPITTDASACSQQAIESCPVQAISA
jgi:ferredoxin